MAAEAPAGLGQFSSFAALCGASCWLVSMGTTALNKSQLQLRTASPSFKMAAGCEGPAFTMALLLLEQLILPVAAASALRHRRRTTCSCFGEQWEGNEGAAEGARR